VQAFKISSNAVDEETLQELEENDFEWYKAKYGAVID